MRRRALLQAGSTAATAAMAGCAAFASDTGFEPWQPDEGWPLAAFDPRNTGYSPIATPPRLPPERITSVDAGSRVRSLAAAGNSVVVGTDDAVRVYDRDLDAEWTAPEGGETVAIRDGTVYAAGQASDGTVVHAHSLADGSRRWRTTYDDQDGLTQLIPIRGAVLVAGTTLLAVAPSSGTRLWSVKASAPVRPSVGEGTLYYATTGLHKVTRRSGIDEVLNGAVDTAELLDTPSIDSRMTVVGDRLYVMVRFPDEAAVLLAFERGSEQWRAPISVSGYSGQAVDRETGYAAGYETIESGAGAGVIGAYALADGDERWQERTAGWLHAPVLAGGEGTAETVLAHGGGDGGEVYAFDTRDGTRLWNVSAADAVDAVAPVGSRVYAGTRDGTVFALA